MDVAGAGVGSTATLPGWLRNVSQITPARAASNRVVTSPVMMRCDEFTSLSLAPHHGNRFRTKGSGLDAEKESHGGGAKQENRLSPDEYYHLPGSPANAHVDTPVDLPVS
jgi:hypothetical protein